MAVFPLLICLTARLIRESPRVARPHTPDQPAQDEAGASGPAPEQEAAGLLSATSTGSGAARGGGQNLMVQLRALNAALGTPGIYLPALFLFAWTVRVDAGTARMQYLCHAQSQGVQHHWLGTYPGAATCRCAWQRQF